MDIKNLIPVENISNVDIKGKNPHKDIKYHPGGEIEYTPEGGFIKKKKKVDLDPCFYLISECGIKYWELDSEYLKSMFIVEDTSIFYKPEITIWLKEGCHDYISSSFDSLEEFNKARKEIEDAINGMAKTVKL